VNLTVRKDKETVRTDIVFSVKEGHKRQMYKDCLACGFLEHCRKECKQDSFAWLDEFKALARARNGAR
jgi:radical SAM protein with 4Fe4S-binding SPASM domain